MWGRQYGGSKPGNISRVWSDVSLQRNGLTRCHQVTRSGATIIYSNRIVLVALFVFSFQTKYVASFSIFKTYIVYFNYSGCIWTSSVLKKSGSLPFKHEVIFHLSINMAVLFHLSSSLVKIKLHTKNHIPILLGTDQILTTPQCSVVCLIDNNTTPGNLVLGYQLKWLYSDAFEQMQIPSNQLEIIWFLNLHLSIYIIQLNT